MLGRIHTGLGGQACDTPPPRSGRLPGPARPTPSPDPIRPGNSEPRRCQQPLCSEGPRMVQVSPTAVSPRDCHLQVGKVGAGGNQGGDETGQASSMWHSLPPSSPVGCHHVGFRRWDQGIPQIKRQDPEKFLRVPAWLQLCPEPGVPHLQPHKGRTNSNRALRGSCASISSGHQPTDGERCIRAAPAF